MKNIFIIRLVQNTILVHILKWWKLVFWNRKLIVREWYFCTNRFSFVLHRSFFVKVKFTRVYIKICDTTRRFYFIYQNIYMKTFCIYFYYSFHKVIRRCHQTKSIIKIEIKLSSLSWFKKEYCATNLLVFKISSHKIKLNLIWKSHVFMFKVRNQRKRSSRVKCFLNS